MYEDLFENDLFKIYNENGEEITVEVKEDRILINNIY